MVQLPLVQKISVQTQCYTEAALRSGNVGSHALGTKAISRIICYVAGALPVNMHILVQQHLLCAKYFSVVGMQKKA